MFGRKQVHQGGGMKFQIVLVALAVGGMFVFRDQISDYFGLESGKSQLDSARIGLMADEGLIKSNGTALYSSRNGKAFGTASAGDRVAVLAEDNGWIQIHHNGLTAWVHSSDIELFAGNEQ